MKSILAIIIFSITVTFQHFFFNHTGLEKSEIIVAQDSVLTATLCLVGDLMCHSNQFNYAKVDADSFNFTGVYREVRNHLSAADLTVGNLESVIAGKNKGYRIRINRLRNKNRKGDYNLEKKLHSLPRTSYMWARTCRSREVSSLSHR